MAYTLQEAVNVSRAISEYLEKDPNLLKTEGALRVPGNDKHARQIVDDLKSGEPLVVNENYTVHDYVSALKKVLKVDPNNNSHLIEPYQLSELISPDGAEEKKRASAEALDTFIKTLINHGNTAAAEMIHNYFHLAFMTASHKEENKMDVSNVAMVLAGTLAPHMLPEGQDMVQQITEMKKICENALNMATTLHTYDRPYNKSYAKERTPFLTQQLEAINSQIQHYNETIKETQAALKELRDSLSAISALKFRTIKAIKREIKAFEASLSSSKTLLAQTQNHHIVLARQQQTLSTSSPDMLKRASPVMLSHHGASQRPTEPPPSPPRPNRPRMN